MLKRLPTLIETDGTKRLERSRLKARSCMLDRFLRYNSISILGKHDVSQEKAQHNR